MVARSACIFQYSACKIDSPNLELVMADFIPKNYFHEKGYYGHDDVINLSFGAPGPQVLRQCPAPFQTATAHRMEQEKKEGDLFQYGPSLGDWKFRVNLSKFLSTNYQETVNVENVMVTGGASQGLYLTTSLLFNPNSLVFVEDPTYFLAPNVFKQDLRMNVVPVPLDADGISLKTLEEEISKRLTPETKNTKSRFAALLYLIPAHQNPTGICYSEARCQELVELAEKYKLMLFCDDVYNLLTYDEAKPPKPLVFYDNLAGEGCVVSNCTFSKIMGPGLRLGWIHCSAQILKFFGEGSFFIMSGGNVNNCMSGIMASFLELGLQSKHLSKIRKLFKYNMEQICALLKKNLPPGCSFVEPKGGYFVWIKLPKNVAADDFVKYATEKYKVKVLAGNNCSIVGNFPDHIRIAVTFHETSVLLDAVKCLCDALAAFPQK